MSIVASYSGLFSIVRAAAQPQSTSTCPLMRKHAVSVSSVGVQLAVPMKVTVVSLTGS